MQEKKANFKLKAKQNTFQQNLKKWEESIKCPYISVIRAYFLIYCISTCATPVPITILISTEPRYQ